jgi:hypothetical protein
MAEHILCPSTIEREGIQKAMRHKVFGRRAQAMRHAVAATIVGGTLTFLAPHAALALEADSIGKAIPHNLAVLDQTDQVRNFKALTAKKGLILLFSRSLAW